MYDLRERRLTYLEGHGTWQLAITRLLLKEVRVPAKGLMVPVGLI